MEKKVEWKRDPAFWVVVGSFVLFVAVAIAVFRSSPNLHIVSGNPVVSRSRTAESSSIGLTGVQRIMIDARSTTKWVHFNLSEGRIVHPRFVSSQNWDLAFKRYHIIANGGVTNLAAAGAILDLGRVDFNRTPSIPSIGFILNTKAPNGLDPENLAIHHWYNYDYASHILTPMPHVYLVRTPDGRDFVFRILDYYCRTGQSGCMTFEYHQVNHRF